MNGNPQSIHPPGVRLQDPDAQPPYPVEYMDLPLSELLGRLAAAERRAQRAEADAAKAWEESLGRPPRRVALEMHERLRRVRIALETPGRDSVALAELQDALYGALNATPQDRGLS